MAFRKYPIEFKVRSMLDKDGDGVRALFKDTKLLLRYTKVEGDPTDPPRIVAILREGVEQLDPKWWEIKEVSSDSTARTFAVWFKASKFNEAFRPSDPTCNDERLLYEAFLDQATIVIKLDMGLVPLGPDDTHCTKPDQHIASLHLLLGHQPD